MDLSRISQTICRLTEVLKDLAWSPMLHRGVGSAEVQCGGLLKEMAALTKDIRIYGKRTRVLKNGMKPLRRAMIPRKQIERMPSLCIDPR